MTRIGVIGIGFVGKTFVDELRADGYPLTVYNRSAHKMDYAIERGANGAESPAEVTDESDVILLAVPGTPEVEAVMEGDDGVLGRLREGQLVIDASTTLPETAANYEAKCADRGAGFLSAPLTKDAPAGGVHMVVGGTEANYEAATEILDCISENHIRVGGIEKGLLFKYLMQIRYAAREAIDAEIVELGHEYGVESRLLNDFLGMDIDADLFEDDYTQTMEGMGTLAIWNKDLGYALDVGRRTDTAMPLTAMVHEIYKYADRFADPDEGDASTIATYWRALNGRL